MANGVSSIGSRAAAGAGGGLFGGGLGGGLFEGGAGGLGGSLGTALTLGSIGSLIESFTNKGRRSSGGGGGLNNLLMPLLLLSQFGGLGGQKGSQTRVVGQPTPAGGGPSVQTTPQPGTVAPIGPSADVNTGFGLQGTPGLGLGGGLGGLNSPFFGLR